MLKMLAADDGRPASETAEPETDPFGAVEVPR
jgi:hypothetical protein